MQNERQPILIFESEHAGGRRAVSAPRHMAGFKKAGSVFGYERHRRAQEGSLHMLPFAGERAVKERAEHSVASVHAGQMIGKRNSHSLRLAWIGQQAQ